MCIYFTMWRTGCQFFGVFFSPCCEIATFLFPMWDSFSANLEIKRTDSSHWQLLIRAQKPLPFCLSTHACFHSIDLSVHRNSIRWDEAGYKILVILSHYKGKLRNHQIKNWFSFSFSIWNALYLRIIFLKSSL